MDLMILFNKILDFVEKQLKNLNDKLKKKV